MPIANAKVEIYKDSTLITTGYTDSEGRFKYSLDVGTYTIVISKTGYQTITKVETVGTRTQLVVNLPESIALGTKDFDLTLSCVKDYTVSSQDKNLTLACSYETVLA